MGQTQLLLGQKKQGLLRYALPVLIEAHDDARVTRVQVGRIHLAYFGARQSLGDICLARKGGGRMNEIETSIRHLDRLVLRQVVEKI